MHRICDTTNCSSGTHRLYILVMHKRCVHRSTHRLCSKPEKSYYKSRMKIKTMESISNKPKTLTDVDVVVE